ncbi:MAG: nucleotidyltransferase domain-containing protein [Phycisphaerae bacterium]|nr:nucleotidyltransferase domain-containing protein [Phycisphaerae bacterium]
MKFDTNKLSESLNKQCPEIIFAILHGSSQEGIIREGSDIDIAIYINGKATLDLYQQIYGIVASVVPDSEPDIGILNNTEPVYRFETLKGKLLFSRDEEKFLEFFSLTCREYENQIADYERQHKYRLEAKNLKLQSNN